MKFLSPSASAFLIFSCISCGIAPTPQPETVKPSANLLNRVEETSFAIGKCMSNLDPEVERRHGIPPRNEPERLQRYIEQEARIKSEKSKTSSLPSSSSNFSPISPVIGDQEKRWQESQYQTNKILIKTEVSRKREETFRSFCASEITAYQLASAEALKAGHSNESIGGASQVGLLKSGRSPDREAF